MIPAQLSYTASNILAQNKETTVRHLVCVTKVMMALELSFEDVDGSKTWKEFQWYS
jgi:hypothetical protein